MVKDATEDSEVTATIGNWLLSIGYPQSDRPRASLRDRVSKTPSAWGSTKAACQFSGVVADKQCTCPASKLMRERYPPTPFFAAMIEDRRWKMAKPPRHSPFSILHSPSSFLAMRETRLKHREKPHKL